MEYIEIKKVGVDELLLLQTISKETFLEAFSANNTEENMAKYLAESLSLEKLGAEMSNVHSSFYFAWSEGKVIGYLKLNWGYAQTELQAEKCLEIERIYVLKAFYGKKVGQMLYEKAIEVAKQTNSAYIWLGVWEENPRAIRFYQKNGFVAFGSHIFMLGDDKQMDILMKLELEV